MYLVYILVVIFGRFINQKIKRKRGIVSNRNEFSSTTTRRASVVANIDVNNIDHDEIFINDERQQILNGQEGDEENERKPLMGSETTNEIIVQYPLGVVIRKGLRTFTKSEWNEANVFMKAFLIIQVYLCTSSKILFNQKKYFLLVTSYFFT